MFPDEVCRLGWARLLSGTGPHYEFMAQAAYCQPYYPLLLAPIQWITDEPATVHRAIFAINSAFAAACLPMAVRLGIRHFELGAGSAWVAGIAILAYPSLTLYSHHAMPETMLFPAVLLALGLWCNWVDRPNWRQFTILLGMAVVLYAIHRKMLVVPLALMVGATIGFWFNRSPRYRRRILITALALSVALWLDNFVKEIALSAYLQAGDANAVDMLARLTDLPQIQRIAGRAAGLMVYATLVTGGLIWLLVGSGLYSIHRGLQYGFRPMESLTKKSAFAFAMVVLLGALTAAYFSTSARFDTWFYGRHVDSVLGIALLPTIAMIARHRFNAAMLRWGIAVPCLALVVTAAANPGPPWSDFSPIHVIGAGPVMEWMHQAGNRWILLAYCAAILAIAGAIFLALLPALFRFAALAPFAILATTIHLTTKPFEGVPFEQAVSEPAANMLREANPCHIHFDERNGGRLRGHQIFRLQYYFPNCSMEITSANQPLPPDSLVVALRNHANCGPSNECYDLHPDLVLKRITGE